MVKDCVGNVERKMDCACLSSFQAGGNCLKAFDSLLKKSLQVCADSTLNANFGSDVVKEKMVSETRRTDIFLARCQRMVESVGEFNKQFLLLDSE